MPSIGETTQQQRQVLIDRMMNAQAILENADQNWATLTAAQKDQAAQFCCRVTAALIRFVLNNI